MSGLRGIGGLVQFDTALSSDGDCYIKMCMLLFVGVVDGRIYTRREDCSLLGHHISRGGVAETNHTYDEIYERQMQRC